MQDVDKLRQRLIDRQALNGQYQMQSIYVLFFRLD